MKVETTKVPNLLTNEFVKTSNNEKLFNKRTCTKQWWVTPEIFGAKNEW